MTFSLTVLGCSGMFATRARAASGYLLDLDGTRLWLDAGSGTWRNLLQFIDYGQIDGVLLSHRHPDHTTDVFQAFHARHYGGSEPLPPIPLWAPADTMERVCGFADEVQQTFDLRTVAAGGEIRVGPATVSFVSMAHPVETVGVRVENDGVSFAYSADTGPDADFATLAGGVDLFVCEATLQDSDESWEGHMSASAAADVARRVGAGRLLLTHLPPDRDRSMSLEQAIRSGGDLSIDLAEDGMTCPVAR